MNLWKINNDIHFILKCVCERAFFCFDSSAIPPQVELIIKYNSQKGGGKLCIEFPIKILCIVNSIILFKCFVYLINSLLLHLVTYHLLLLILVHRKSLRGFHENSLIPRSIIFRPITCYLPLSKANDHFIRMEEFEMH